MGKIVEGYRAEVYASPQTIGKDESAETGGAFERKVINSSDTGGL
jgi:hypothetical protein